MNLTAEKVVHILVWSTVILGFVGAFLISVILPNQKYAPEPLGDILALRLDENGFLVRPSGEPVLYSSAIDGWVNEMTVGEESISITGWAINFATNMPAKTVVLLIGARVAGYGPVDVFRPGIAQERASLGMSGFKLDVSPVDLSRPNRVVVRVFALDQEDRARELHYKQNFPLRTR